ncbi:DUF559 domain-containing protein [Actinoplanes sp. NBRC 103695]|uniref:DUF559 domain-containing protein n=1 Tax=Actinoplanes sp. NBRC 103695 TaxID=3032202 RepID=UPI002556B0A1|nr:DUF559 domain-containing protein [Actinoplanes sp. NBRC 103695]
MLRGPSWRQLLPDVYVDAGATLDHRLWCAAVALTLRGDSAIDRYSAAHLHGVELLPPDAPVTVTVPKPAHPWRHPRVRTFRTMLEPGDRIVLDGIPVTTGLRTAFDLGRQPDPAAAVAALDALCRSRLATVAEVARYAGDRRHLQGARLLLRRLPLVDPRAESPMESRLRVLIAMTGLPAPVPQYEVWDRRDRLAGRVDLGWPHWRVAAEYDGDQHREQATFRRDVARLNALHEAGWAVLRFTAPDLLDHPAETVRRIAAALI